MRGQNVAVIAQATLREAIRGKHILGIGVSAIVLVALATVFGLVTIGEQGRVIKDFGLFAASFAVASYAAIAGTSFLEKEVSRKTVYNVLSRGVTRSEFIVGKWLGLVAACTALLVGLSITTASLSAISTKTVDPLLVVAFGYGFLELLLICSLAIFFSSIVVTPILSGIFTMALFFAGRSAHYFLYFVEQGGSKEPLTSILKVCFWALPNLAEINVANDLVFGIAPSVDHFVMAVAYGCAYSCFLIFLSCILFERRNFL